MVSHLVGQQLGKYRLIRILGTGGFASVYLGEHIHLHTQAAIKVLDTHLVSDGVEKFCDEARIIAHLAHPHIVRVFDFDVVEGIPFLIMDYAPNGTLRQHHPTGAPIPLTTIVNYVKQVGAALQHAHENKLIHRDVKPENLLLGRYGEVLLSDFGIAVISQSSNPEHLQQAIGSIRYMAPEQIKGKPRRASDQYALGVVVYEWLSGFPPFIGSREDITRQHLETPPPSLRERIPALLPEIEQVVLKALAKNPRERFENVKEFAVALQQACEPKPGLSLYSEQTELISPSVGTICCTYDGHTAPVQALAWSPDCHRIASASYDTTVRVWVAVQGNDAATKGSNIYTYKGHSNRVNGVAWSPDGQRIASASQDGTVHVWEAITGKNIFTYTDHSGKVSAVAWSPDGQYVASAGQDRLIHIWKPGFQRQYHGHTDNISAVAYSPDGTRIASGSLDRTVRVWDALTGRNICTYLGHAEPVNAVVWSPDGQRIASAGDDKKVRVWDATTGQKMFTYRGHMNYVNALACSPDGGYIASAGYDNTVQVWSAANGAHLFTYRGHSKAVNALQWSHDSTHIVSASSDCTVQIWQAIP